MRQALLISLAILCAGETHAASFRCGTRIVMTGDPVSRLVRNCGQPAFRYKAREVVGSRGGGKPTGVTNWVYERGRKKDMIVSVQGGRVVKIAVE